MLLATIFTYNSINYVLIIYCYVGFVKIFSLSVKVKCIFAAFIKCLYFLKHSFPTMAAYCCKE